MIEAILTGVVSLVIGASGGMAALNARTTNKVAELDRRIDAVMAQAKAGSAKEPETRGRSTLKLPSKSA